MKALDPANHHTQTLRQLLPQYQTKLQTTFSRPWQGIMHGLGDTKRPMGSGDGQMVASGHSVIGKLENQIILGEMKTLLKSTLGQLVCGMMILTLNLQKDRFVNMIQLMMVSRRCDDLTKFELKLVKYTYLYSFRLCESVWSQHCRWTFLKPRWCTVQEFKQPKCKSLLNPKPIGTLQGKRW